MRHKMLTDRDYIQKSARAFVSFVRSFKEHQLSNILKVSLLDPVSLARSFFLFKLPVMKEFKDFTVPKDSLATPEELEKFAAVEYLNKNQEAMVHKKVEEAIEGRKDC